MSARTVTVEVSNQSSHMLVLRGSHLDHGVWPTAISDPPQAIAAGETALWTSASDGFMTGTAGWAKFGLFDKPVHVLAFRWSNPFVGTNEYFEESSSEQVLISGWTDGGKYDSTRRVSVEDAPLDFVGPPQMPAAVSWDDSRLDVFVVSSSKVAHRHFERSGNYYDPSGWGAWWEPLDRPPMGIAAGIGAASWGRGRLDIAVIDQRGRLAHRSCDNSSWTDWQELDGNDLRGTPTLVAPRPNTLVVVAFDAAGQLWARVYAGVWQPWALVADLPSANDGDKPIAPPPFTSAPAAVLRKVDDRWESSAPGRPGTELLEVYGLAVSGDVLQVVLSFVGDKLAYSGFRAIAPPEHLDTAGASVVPSPTEPGRVDAFFPTAAGKVIQLVDDGSTETWQLLSLMAQTAPSAAWLMPGDLHVFTYDLENYLRHERYFDRVWMAPDVLGSPRQQRMRRQPIHTDADAGGFVQLNWNSDGDVIFSGKFHATGGWSYDMAVVASLLTDAGTHLVFREHGHVSGDDEIGSDTHLWSTPSNLPILRATFGDFSDAAFMIDERDDETMFAPLLDDLGYIFGSVAAVIGSGVVVLGVIVLATAELLGIVDEKATQGFLRVSESAMAMLGPAGTLFAFAEDAIANIGEDSREMTLAEYSYAANVFGTSLPPREDIVITSSYRHSDKTVYRAYTFPRADGTFAMNFGPDWQDPEHYQYPAKVPWQTLIHELVHVWQAFHQETLGAFGKFWSTFVADPRDDAGRYDFGDASGKAFVDLNLEEQAAVVEHWYLGKDVYNGPVVRAPMDPASPLYRFVRDNIRTGLTE